MKTDKNLDGGVGLGLLSSNLASAGHGVGLPGIMQYNNEGGKLYNQPENIIFGNNNSDKKYGNVILRYKNMLQDYGLETIGNFYRGEKKFISTEVVRVHSYFLDNYHYSNYNKEQEEEYRGRTRVYGIWEGRGGVYNLYDPKGEKWGECVPYFLSGTNRVLQMYSGANFLEWGNYLNINDPITRGIINFIDENATITTRRVFDYYRPYILSEKNKKFFSPMFFGKYHADSLGIQFHIPYVVNEQGVKQKDINLISNAGHLNGILDPADVKFDFTFY